MHPREGWQGHGAPRRASGAALTRRAFLRRGATAGLLAAGGGTLLGACDSFLTGATTVPLPRRNNPVRWPTAGNPMIKSGLPPETGATLQIYNWVAYVNQACLNKDRKSVV